MEEPLFVEAEMDPATPYIQARVHYTVRVYRSTRLQQGVLLPPEVADAVLEPLGPEPERRVERDGHRYHLSVHRYALFPQRTGVLKVPPAVFSGREVFARGPALRLEVRPPPPGADDGWWLPARGVTLRERWPEGSPRVGEAVLQEVTLTARGLTAAQLPEPRREGMAGWRVYSAGEEKHDRVVAGEPVGERRWRRYWVPQEPGRQELPAVRLRWWDLTAGVPATEVLPARTVTVRPATAARATPQAAPRMDAPAGRPPARAGGPGPLAWVVAAAGAALAVWAAQRLAAGGGRRATRWRLRRDVLHACRRGRPADLSATLLRWAGAVWPESPPGTLRALARRSGDPALDRALRDLDRGLYGPEADPATAVTDCRELDRGLRRSRPARTRCRPGPLPPLNP